MAVVCVDLPMIYIYSGSQKGASNKPPAIAEKKAKRSDKKEKKKNDGNGEKKDVYFLW